MYDDYAVDWLNIECQLSEAIEYDIEDELISEGLVTKGILAGAKYGTYGVTKAAGAAIRMSHYNPVQGAKNLGSLTAGVMRSPLMRSSFWSRLLNKLKELWQRFKNIIVSLFKSNSSFVNTELTNVEAVVNKAMHNNETASKLYEMTFKDIYPYWMRQDLIPQIVLPPLNINDTTMMQSLADKNVFISRYIRPLSRIDFQSAECAENVKNLFRGGGSPTSVGFSQLAPYIRNISDVCRNTGAIVNKLQIEQRQNEQAANEAMRKLEELEHHQNANDQQATNMTVQSIQAIRNYISISQLILGCKETVLQERYIQSVGIMRKLLFSCKSVATKQEVQNMEVDRSTYVNDPLQGKNPVTKTIKRVTDPEGSKKEVHVTDTDYTVNIPNDKAKIEKEIQKINSEKESIEKYLHKLSSRLPKNNQQREYMEQQLDLYKRRLAILTNKYNSIKD